MSGADAFIVRFSETWRDPDPEAFADLFTSDGILFHPTMAGPIPARQVPDYVRRIKALVPDLTLEVDNWAAREEVVLIEWTIHGTFGGQRLSWKGMDRFSLQEDKAKEGVAYFDTFPLWVRIDPTLERPALESALADSAARS